MNKSYISMMDNVLSRGEMKKIIAGSSGGCRVAWRNSDGSFAGYSSCTTMDPALLELQVDEAYTDADTGQYVSGYCCASCGTGDFSNADPCP